LFGGDAFTYLAEEATMKPSLIKASVDRKFRELSAKRGELCRNPVVGDGDFVTGVDPLKPQKEMAYRALLAQEWFALYGPRDAPPLPIYNTSDAKRGQGLLHLLAYFTQSLSGQDYAVHIHPSFEDYAAGVLASPGVPWFFERNEELKKRFPPRPLPGLDQQNLCWLTPEQDAKMKARNSRSTRAAANARAEQRTNPA
jgi:hypothetical protein